MKDYIMKRVIDVANYMLVSNATVRRSAEVFCVSKSTIHKDCTERLEQLDKSLAKRVRRVLDINWSEKHVRGGNALALKYSKRAGGSQTS